MGDESVNMAEATLLQLSDSISQYAATAINTVTLPQFQGLPNEDVYDFLKRFKLATITFTPDLQCLALNRALQGAAHTWSKSIKDKIQSGDWKNVKKAMIERFAAPDREMRYRERLAKMKHDPTKETLTSYLEEFIDCYRKANSSVSDKEIIVALKVNLPNSVIRNLNLLSDNWTEATELNTLFKLVRRIENKILPYEPTEDKDGSKLNIQSLTKILEDLKESFKTVKAKQDENKDQEVVAAIQHQRASVPGPVRQGRPFQPQFRNYNYRTNQDRRNWYRGNEQPYNQGFRRQSDENFPATTRMLPEKRGQEGGSTETLLTSYEKMYGKLPGPCQICQGQHFNRHCPYKDLN